VVAKVLCGYRGVLSVFFHCYSGARVLQLVTRVLLSYSKCVFLSCFYAVARGLFVVAEVLSVGFFFIVI